MAEERIDAVERWGDGARRGLVVGEERSDGNGGAVLGDSLGGKGSSRGGPGGPPS